MEHLLIKGPEDYQMFFHTDREGNIWFDGKGNPIARDNPPMDTEVESVSPSELWTGRSTRSNIHSTEAPAEREESHIALIVNNSSQ